MVDWIKNKLTQIKERLGCWSGWDKAGSIFLSRMEAILAFVGAALIGIDWDAILNLDFSNGINNAVLLGLSVIVIRAFIYEYVRRKGTKDF